MEYRVIYNLNKIIDCVQNEQATETVTKFTNYRWIIDTLENSFNRLSSWGVDVSYFWKNDFIDRIVPSDITPEIDISDFPSDPTIKRKVFVYGMSIDQIKKQFRLNIVVRHFDVNGNHVTDVYDDGFYSSLATNGKLVGGVGEFDYFVGLINQGANMFQLQAANIPIIDSNGGFNNIY